MTLAQRYRSAFTNGVRERGRDYFLDGQVRIEQINDRLIRAKVRGSTLYDVAISLYPNGKWHGECSCPFQRDRLEPCKHLWATMLAADVQQVVKAQESGSGWRPASQVRAERQRKDLPEWKRRMVRIRESMVAQGKHAGATAQLWPEDRRIVYVIDAEETAAIRQGVVMELATERLKNGRWQALKRFQFDVNQWMAVPDEADRVIAQMLLGAKELGGYTYGSGGIRRFILPPSAYETTLRRMCETGRCMLRAEKGDSDLTALAWDDGPAWEFRLGLSPRSGAARFELRGWLQRGEERIKLRDPVLISDSGLMIRGAGISHVQHFGAFELLAAMQQERWIMPIGAAKELLKEVYALPAVPPVEVPPEAGIDQVLEKPTPRLMFQQKRGGWRSDRVSAELSFNYAGRIVQHGVGEPALFDESAGTVIRRDPAAESEAWEKLVQLGFRSVWDQGMQRSVLLLAQDQLPATVVALTAHGWQVEAEGKLYRTPGTIRVEVSSGIDWFDLTAEVSFGEETVGLPALLEALRTGRRRSC